MPPTLETKPELLSAFKGTAVDSASTVFAALREQSQIETYTQEKAPEKLKILAKLDPTKLGDLTLVIPEMLDGTQVTVTTPDGQERTVFQKKLDINTFLYRDYEFPRDGVPYGPRERKSDRVCPVQATIQEKLERGQYFDALQDSLQGTRTQLETAINNGSDPSVVDKPKMNTFRVTLEMINDPEDNLELYRKVNAGLNKLFTEYDSNASHSAEQTAAFKKKLTEGVYLTIKLDKDITTQLRELFNTDQFPPTGQLKSAIHDLYRVQEAAAKKQSG